MTLTPADLNFLEQAYGWNITEIATLHQGENKSYAVTTSAGRCVVRRYRKNSSTAAEVDAELEWLATLKNAVPVVPALRTRNGARCVVRNQDEEQGKKTR